MSMTDAAMEQAPQQGAGPMGSVAGNDEKQQQFERFASQLLEYLYSDEGMASTKEVLGNAGDDVPGAIGSIVAKSMAGLVVQARQIGSPVDPEVVYAIAIQLCNAVTDIAMQMGMVEEGEADDDAEDAFYAAIGDFSDMAQTLSLTPEEADQYEAMAADLGKLEEFRDQNGGEMPAPGTEQAPAPGTEQAPAPGMAAAAMGA